MSVNIKFAYVKFENVKIAIVEFANVKFAYTKFANVKLVIRGAILFSVSDITRALFTVGL
jgi:hypothetical protein